MSREITIQDMQGALIFKIFAIIAGGFATGAWFIYFDVSKAVNCADCICLGEAIVWLIAAVLSVSTVVLWLTSVIGLCTKNDFLRRSVQEESEKKQEDLYTTLQKCRPNKFKIGDKIIGNNLGLARSEYQNCLKGNGYGIVRELNGNGTVNALWFEADGDRFTTGDLDTLYFDLANKSKKTTKKKTTKKKTTK